MADKKDDKTAKAPTKTITLKRSVESGTVRQSFSHGRSKSVVVETVKRRTVGGPAKPAAAKAAPAQRETPKSAPRAEAPQKPSGVVLRTLTEEEREARDRALIDARSREAEERKHAEEDAQRRAAREAIDRTEREAAEASDAQP